jgi:hypothetical protein
LKEIQLQVFGQPVRIISNDEPVIEAIIACYSAFQISRETRPEEPLSIAVETIRAGREWTVAVGTDTAVCVDLAFLLYTIEKLMTIELQRRRTDLFFLHAAALRFDSRCLVISGESGVGKSTLCWELCNAGFDYMSDELAPVNPKSLEVEPYPHAIGQKSITGGMAALPDVTLDADQSKHVPAEAIPRLSELTPTRLDRIIFLTGSQIDGPLVPVRISIAEAAARIYTNGLNQLAHDQDGLGAVSQIAKDVPCYLFARSSIGEMRDSLISAMQDDA